MSFAANSDGYVDSMLSSIGDSLYIDWRGAMLSGVEQVTVNLRFDPGANELPEPASSALLGLGLAGVAAARRRKTAR